MIYFNAFIFGGFLCAVAQIIMCKTKLTPARILVSYVVAGVILSGIGVYGPLVEIFGAGATVPIMGFGHCLAKGVVKAVTEQGPLGILSGGIIGAAAGIAAAVFFGYIISLIFSPKGK